jgi:hypothetical protein
MGDLTSAKAAAIVLVLGAVFAGLGDLLFYRAAGLGLNVALWIGALALAAWRVHGRTHEAPGAVSLLLGVGCFFAAGLAWRASEFLRFWNVVAVVAVATTVAVRLRGALPAARIADYTRGAVDLAGAVTVGPVQALREAPWPDAGHTPGRSAAVVLGAVLAVPVVLVFGSLLAAADPAMDALVQVLVDWDLEAVVAHLAILGVTGWLATGWLRHLGVARSRTAAPWAGRIPALGAIELGIPLGALTLLLAVFIGLQTRYLFGGEAFIRQTGITYAAFARRGFFELVAVCGLALPLLVGAQRLVDRAARRAVESFRALAPTLAVLMGLVMVSAVARMRLYVDMYGLTEDRFYATAFMLWLGAVLVWFVVTEFRGRLDHFATGAVTAGFLLLAALNVVNPDALIARTNLARASAGLELDVTYLSRLSTDAVPALLTSQASPDTATRDAAQAILSRQRDTDWRAWTWSAWRARHWRGVVQVSRTEERAWPRNYTLTRDPPPRGVLQDAVPWPSLGFSPGPMSGDAHGVAA